MYVCISQVVSSLQVSLWVFIQRAVTDANLYINLQTKKKLSGGDSDLMACSVTYTTWSSIHQCDSSLLYCQQALAVPVAVLSGTSQQRAGLECKCEHTRVRTHTRNGQEVRKWTTVTTKKVPMHLHRVEMRWRTYDVTHVHQSKSTLYWTIQHSSALINEMDKFLQQTTVELYNAV
jgi:hypothetical protein